MNIGQKIKAERRYMIAEKGYGYWSWEDEVVEGVIVSFCRNGYPIIETKTRRWVVIDSRCTILEVE